jgi:hypothetical protein
VRTLGTLLAERRGAVVGRECELAALRDGPPVMVVHGVAGSGKTALLRAFRAELAGRVVSLDGRAIEPTPQAFLAAVGEDFDTLVIDTAERLRLLDGWLRQEFLPSLPAHARVVIATRDAPGAVWRASFGELLQTIALGPLSPADAADVLRAAGLDEGQVEWVNRFVRGHPLSLQLAASAVRERPDAPEDVVLPTVVQELAALYLDGLDPETREVLDAASVLRRVTLSLLGALLPEHRPQDAFARLDALPFVELGREGLVIHDTVRETVSALLRASDPVRHRRYRSAAWRQIRKELETPRWASVADMIALVDEPLVREAFFPSAVQHYAIETARADDGPAIEAITARHEAEAEVARMRAWWAAMPSAFRVARSPRGEVVAFTLLCEFSQVPRRLLDADPLCVAWRAHLRAQPVAPGDEVLLARQTLAWATGSASSPCFAALLRDLERASLAAGPKLRRVYSAARVAAMRDQLAPIGFVELDGPEVFGYRPILLDLGPESAVSWLSTLAARDLDLPANGLDEGARELRLDGERIALSKLECDVMRYLIDREGQPVARDTLLRDVWGYEWTGGSNVVDVAISGLRRKLGDRAGSLQTVRGVGYRFTG